MKEKLNGSNEEKKEIMLQALIVENCPLFVYHFQTIVKEICVVEIPVLKCEETRQKLVQIY